MTGSYTPHLVWLSVGVAILASYTMLEIASRIHTMEQGTYKRQLWMVGGAVVMGNGIWSMHFIGMLACRMTMGASYYTGRTLLSLLLAVGIAYFALHIATTQGLGLWRLSGGAVAMGGGIAGMHYLGMSAIKVEAPLHYRPWIVLLSIVIAVTASWTALWIAFSLSSGTVSRRAMKRIASSLLMGLAIAGMHYVGMSAAIMPAGMNMGTREGYSTLLLLVVVPLLSVCGLIVALLMSAVVGSMETQFPSLDLTSDAATYFLDEVKELDPVTELKSRTSFLLELERKMEKACKADKPLGLVFLDLDGFKLINDSIGYTAGDLLLKAFSGDLQGRVREGTTLGRLGGDEFALVLEGFEYPEKLVPIARSILERMRTDFEVEGVVLKITASAGIALYPRDGNTVDKLLKGANIAMRTAKLEAKGTFRVFDPKMSDAATRATQIQRGLGEALLKNQFSLVFQPKFDGKRGGITGAEALIRWTHPVLGNVSPMDFIPLAEKTGQIVAISEWVIREVCWQMTVWLEMGLPPVRVAINLSPEQLKLAGYAERVSEMVRLAGIDPQWIMFEITETAAMREPKLASAAIAQFQRAGFDFAIDDFGTGYSSMAYLQQFRVKELKIDRFFVASLEGAEEGQTIVAAIIALAHALHMTVVAEGVETSEQLQKLQGMKCDEIQGYLLGRPVMPKDFEKLLRGESDKDELAGVKVKKPWLVAAMG